MTTTAPLIRTNNHENKERGTVVWFDANININENIEYVKKQLHHVNDSIVFYSNPDSCFTFMKSKTFDNIFLIVSDLSTSDLLYPVHAFVQIKAIFIFSSCKLAVQQLLIEYPKIIDLYTDIHRLCLSLQEQIDLVHHQTWMFFVLDRNQPLEKILSKNNFWRLFLNDLIFNLPQNERTKSHMIDICRQYYKDNFRQQQMIDDFEVNYRPAEALRWYLNQSFIYKLIEKALVIVDIDQLYIFRFFIRDLSDSLAREHQKIHLKSAEILTVYRATQLSNHKFNLIIKSIGKFITVNTYLIASRHRSVALDFIKKGPKQKDTIPIVLEIECHQNNNVIFADVSEFTNHPNQEQILFDIGTIFQLNSIDHADDICVVKLSTFSSRQAITEDYIEHARQLDRHPSIAIKLGRLLHELGQIGTSIKFFEYLLIDSQNENCACIEYNIRCSLQCELKLIVFQEYYDLASNEMISVKPMQTNDSFDILTNIGSLLYEQKKYDEALEHLKQAYKSREHFYVTNHTDIGQSLTRIGLILSDQGKYDDALEYFRNAVKIKERFYPLLRTNLAINLNYTACILFDQGEYDESVKLLKRALLINRYALRPNDPSIMSNLRKISDILYHQENFNEALEFYQQLLQINENYHPSNYVDIITILNIVGTIFYRQEKYDEVLDCYKRALTMKRKYYHNDHINIATNLQSIGEILYKQGKCDAALQFYQQALKIQERHYPSGHVYIVHNLNMIALSLYDQEQYDQALEFFQRALTMRERCCSSDYLGMVTNLYMIGGILYYQEKYDEALRIYQRALKLHETCFSSDYINIAISFETIAGIYFDQEKYDEAMAFCSRALRIREKYIPDGKKEIADILTLIGLIYSNQHETDGALDYLERSLHMKREYAPDDHPSIVITLEGLAVVYGDKGDSQQALAYALECLTIHENFLTEDLIGIGTSLNIIGACYTNLDDRKMATKYYKRALVIFKQNLPLEDPLIETTERNIQNHRRNVQLWYEYGRKRLKRVKARLFLLDTLP